MPLHEVDGRIRLLRRNMKKLGLGKVPRLRLPKKQEQAVSSSPSSEREEETLAPYLSLPNFEIDQFPTSPLPLYTIDSWPTQPLPRVTAQMPLSALAEEVASAPVGEVTTLVMPETRPASVEAPPKPQEKSGTFAGSYLETARKMVKSTGIYALASLASPLVSLVLSPFLTHRFSATAYGLLAILTTVLSLTTGITQLGLGSAFFRVYNYERTEPHERRAVLATVTALLLLFSVPVAIVASLFSSPLAGILLQRPPFGGLVTLTAWIVVVQNLTVPGFAWLRAENRPLFYSLLSISNVVIVLLANLLLVGLLHWGIEGPLVATGSGYAFVALCTLPLILWHSRLRMRKDIAWSLVTFGAPLVLSFVSFWVLQLSDRYLLSVFVSPAQTASYAVAYSLGSVLATLVISPFSLAWPATMFSVAKREDAPHVFRMIFRWFSLVLLFAAFGVSIASSIILDWLFLKSYHAAGSIIPIIAESLVFYGLYTVMMTGANIRRKTWMNAAFTGLAAVGNVGLNLVLIPRFGSAGAAASTLLAYILLALVAYIANQRIYPVPYEIRRFLFALLVGVALYGGADLLSVQWGAFWRWPLMLLCLILYGALLLYLGQGIGLLRRYGARLMTRIHSDRSESLVV
jgi:O-antigen/teichoic acid export membrane protein